MRINRRAKFLFIKMVRSRWDGRWIDQHTGFSRMNNFTDPTNIGSNNGNSEGHRFQHHQWKPFVVRWKNQHVERLQKCRDIPGRTRESHRSLSPKLGDVPFQGSALATLPDQKEKGFRTMQPKRIERCDRGE